MAVLGDSLGGIGDGMKRQFIREDDLGSGLDVLWSDRLLTCFLRHSAGFMRHLVVDFEEQSVDGVHGFSRDTDLWMDLLENSVDVGLEALFFGEERLLGGYLGFLVTRLLDHLLDLA